MGEQQKVNQTEQDLNHVLRVCRGRLAGLQAVGEDPFQITKYGVTVHSMDVKDGHQQWEGKEAVVAGRMMLKCVIGETSLYNVQNLQGTIQVYVARNGIGEGPYKDFKKIDVGDIVGVKGTVFTTKIGGISIYAVKVTLLTKNPQVPPEKFHGPTSTDARYRQRYVDLITNMEVKDTLIKRSRIISMIRTYLSGQGFMEVETPILVANADGAAARPFETHFNALDEGLKTRISLELYLKRLTVSGLERVYEIDRIFRNEGLDTCHNPESTLMGLYQAYTDYNSMIGLTKSPYRHVAQAVLGTITTTYEGVEMDLGRPSARIAMVEAAKKYAGVDFDEVHAPEKARVIAKEEGVEFEARYKKGDILNLLSEESTEEHLVQPTFVLDHPVEISSLTKKKPDNPDYVECFEFFMNGWGMASVYSEINDPIDQRERSRAQEEFLAQEGEETNHTDKDFLNALEVGMPPTRGAGFGIDRMVVLLIDPPTVRDVLLFLTMRTIGNGEPSKKAGETDAIAELSAKTGETTAPIDFSKVKIELLFEEVVDFETFAESDYRVVEIRDCVAVPKSKKPLQLTLGDGSGTDRMILNGTHEYCESEQLIGKTAIVIVNLPPRKMMGIDSCGILISAVHEEDGHEGLNLLMVDDRIPTGAKLYQSVFENSFSPSALRNPPDSV